MFLHKYGESDLSLTVNQTIEKQFWFEYGTSNYGFRKSWYNHKPITHKIAGYISDTSYSIILEIVPILWRGRKALLTFTYKL